MIYHVVLLKLSSSVTSEKLENLNTGLQSLLSIAPVLAIELNTIVKNPYKDYEDRTKGYTHSIFVLLKDRKGLEKYDKDKVHQLIKSTVIKQCLDINVESPVLCIDWEGELPKIKPSLLSRYSVVIGCTALVVIGLFTIRLRSRL